MPVDPWPAPTVTQPLSATVTLPGSKSLVARYLVLAGLAEGRTVLRAPLRSRDTDLMSDAWRRLGVAVDSVIDDGVETWQIIPGALRGGVVAPVQIDCGLAGTVMRFMPPVAALASGDVLFDGDPHARTRPLAPLVNGLRDLGVTLQEGPQGGLPLLVHGAGAVTGGDLTIDASASSQFVSALLLAAPRFERGLTLRHVGRPVPSAPHLRMTVDVLRRFGAAVGDDVPDVWRVEPGGLHGVDLQVEPDLSNAAAFLAAAAVAGGTVTVPGWPATTTQPGVQILDILELMGAQVQADGGRARVTGTGGLHGAHLDLAECGELTPVVAAVAALADSPSTLSGIGHLRGHETDRLAALATELNALGGAVTELGDGLRIEPASLHGGVFGTYHDHRMVHTAALLGLVVPDLQIENVATTAKTLPGFVELWSGMVAR